MKKLLILLICGFAFTQSIQTKQVEVPITQDTESIDISEFRSPGIYISEKYARHTRVGSIIKGLGNPSWYSEIFQQTG